MKRASSLLLILIVFLLAASLPAAAGTADADVLQFKLGRFYFSVGRESLVFPGNHFSIYRGKDTIVRGVIEDSYEGVSIGRGEIPKDGRRNFEKYKAAVQTTEAERLSLVRIGALREEIFPVDSAGGKPLDMPDDGFDSVFLAGADTVLVHYSDDTLEILDLLERGELDAALIQGAPSRRPGFQSHSAFTPLFVTLLSNPEVDKGGLLSTSLYYRFEPWRLSTSVADSIEPLYSFLPGDSSDVRPYPFDPERGKQLQRSIKPNFSLVRFGIMTEHLRSVATYFADLLAREGCRSTIAVDTTMRQSDLLIGLGVISPQVPSVMPLIIRQLLDEAGRHGDSSGIPAYLSRFSEAVDSADAEGDSTLTDEHLRRANSILIHDLGCFPLFRPMYTLITRNDVTGINFDARGCVSVSKPMRLSLPEPPVKEQR